MNQIYKRTLDEALKTEQIVPISLSCRHLVEALQFVTGYEPVDYNEDQRSIDQLNNFFIDILTLTVNELEQFLLSEWHCSSEFIKDYNYNKIAKLISNTILQVNKDTAIQQCQEQYLKIHDNVFELIDILIAQLCDDFLSSDGLNKQLNDILDVQLHRLAYDMFDFSYLDSKKINHLILYIQSLMVKILNQFYDFLIKLSFHSNQQMVYLDDLMDKYKVLANFETYKYLQREIAHKVYEYGEELLESTCFCVYPKSNKQIVKQAIKHFYFLIDLGYENYQGPKPYESFDNLLEEANFHVIKPLPQNIQVIMNDNSLRILKECDSIKVRKAQQNLQTYGIKLTLEHNERMYTFMINLHFHYLLFHEFINDQNLEEPTYPDLNIIQFINSQFDFLHQSCPDIRRRVQSAKSLDRSIDEIQGFRNAAFKYKKVSAPKKPIRYGARTGVVAGKALGAGLGCLLVDCLDEDISWNDKFKNAGITTVSIGMLGILASRLPVIGIIIQQVILAIGVRQILQNKVISDKETSKNLGHLGAQIAIGLGLTITGSIMFPIGFWGAFIGGLCGGIGMGLYSKFVIPFAMENLVEMLTKCSSALRKNGIVKFKHYVVVNLRFKEEYFISHKPSNLSYDQFLTLVIFCLSNEMKALARANLDQQIQKLIKKKVSLNDPRLIDLKQRYIKIQSKLSIWNDTLDYLKSQKISILSHAKEIAQFLEGLISNFKVE